MRGTLTVTRFAAEEIAEWTGGAIGRPGRGEAAGVSTDSRTVDPGDLFVALRGPTFDGHAHAVEALEKGAWGVLVEGGQEDRFPGAELYPDRAIIEVEDTLRALGDLAAGHRRRLDLAVVGITGSNGKTTTKEMTAAVAARRWSVHRTEGNYNNLIGLPLTILGLEESHEVAVLEMGMNRRGEIRRLAQIARPDVGVVTNIGPVHLEHLGGIEGVAAAKGELVEELGRSAAAVLNADDPRTAVLSKSVRGQVLTFGIVRFADFRAGKITAAAEGTTFSLTCPLGKADVSIAFPGEHNVLNALAAAAAGAALGAGLDDIVEGLSAARPVPMRFTVLSYRGGITVVNDAYNANPESARAALRSLGLIEGRGRRAAVLGDMLELGEESAAAHRALGGEAATSIDFMIAVGAFAGETAAGAVAAGLGEEMVRSVPSRREAADLLKEWLRPGDIVLLKGSRGAALEEVLRLLESAGALEEI